jgi:hypothetical protein
LKSLGSEGSDLGTGWRDTRESAGQCQQSRPGSKLDAPKSHETNETSTEISQKRRASYIDPDKRDLLAWEDDMSTFLFLALSSAFLLGMVAGALTRRIVD